MLCTLYLVPPRANREKRKMKNQKRQRKKAETGFALIDDTGTEWLVRNVNCHWINHGWIDLGYGEEMKM